ncbi:hypothetical protein [Cryptosporangium aurantiacum]|uniref:Uncharacterized protein n=1 Tax=Cryptosporangium aurantiacum TaxID=134849 RepID=A0A1M7RLX3_9ACTN|nr:hypothetical protein [Cryptosporangium aurantiacum]SHN47189.1 hypothetical protein SAMN05443668_12137 [Cryptosporangium aurantiacum]
MGISLRTRRLSAAALAAVLTVGVLAACEVGQTTDLGVIRAVDPGHGNTPYYTNRDAGFSARLTGTNASGQSVTRDLWTFGDTDAWNANTGAKMQYFKTNTASLVPPVTPGSVPAVPPMPVEVAYVNGAPAYFTEFITDGARPACPPPSNKPANYYYQARWPSSVIRLPDSDARRETAVVFYQDFCVHLPTQADPDLEYLFKTGGAAQYVWDAHSPDASPHATTLANALFQPGTWRDHSWAVNKPGYTYGAGAYLSDGPSSNQKYLNVLACGQNSDCTQARLLVDSTNLSGSLTRIATATNWSYRTEGASSANTDDAWQALPSSGCAPTPYVTCGTLPLPKPVIKASSDPLTQVSGSPSVAHIGGYLFVAYAVFADDEVAAVRLADSSGVFDPVAGSGLLPAGKCASGCYAPVIHPELNTSDGKIAFSYVANAGVTPPGQTPVATMRLGWTCLETFDTGAPC